MYQIRIIPIILVLFGSTAAGLRGDLPDMSPDEVLSRMYDRYSQLASLAVKVRHLCEFPGGGEPLDASAWISISGDRWAIKWIGNLPLTIPGNYRIGHSDAEYNFHHRPELNSVTHALKIALPSGGIERENQLLTLVKRLGWFWDDVTYEYLAQHSHRLSIDKTEVVGGEECYVMSLDVPPDEIWDVFDSLMRAPLFLREGGRVRLFVAPALGYAMTKYEYLTSRGEIDIEFVYSGFESHGGVYFPTYGSQNRVSSVRDGRYEYASLNQLIVEELVSVNEPIPDREFAIIIPAETQVYDTRPGRQASIVVEEVEGVNLSPGTELSDWIDEHLPRRDTRSVIMDSSSFNSAPRDRATTLLVLANMFVLVVAVILLVSYRWKRRPEDK